MTTHRFEYAVAVGVGDFPFDMLRYDAASPAYEDEIYLLQEADPAVERAIVLQRWHCGPGSWSPSRWGSFLWRLEQFNTQHAARQYSERINGQR